MIVVSLGTYTLLVLLVGWLMGGIVGFAIAHYKKSDEWKPIPEGEYIFQGDKLVCITEHKE